MITFVFLFVIPPVIAIVLFGILFKLSIQSRFEKSKAYLLPLTCMALLVGWTALLFYRFIEFIGGFSVYATLFGILTGSVLSVGSSLWTRRRAFVGGALIIFSLILWVASFMAIVYAALITASA